ncbi:copper transporter [Heterobasidion irregulare TC 32-1]|uniref:Copper transport protein n=1 Tax=Heterobasidion irregulare (strain TC 32-1) TaxID=747525 RepID=W4K1A7_HETIT|nr:copper transporter [Heterobasidion irregulare TC 32-1]ETW79597.1 copper transporter [Heterobasidion irregulare TC 32-1]
MDMSMDGGMSLSMGNMIMYLHFTPGDNLWFLGWVASSPGAMVGACIGLFMLGMVDRWLGAMRAVMEMHWHARAQIALSNKLNSHALPTSREGGLQKGPSPLRNFVSHRAALPFIPAHDISRGIVHVTQTLLSFLFMLAVMTFQVGFILSIVVGLGVGETLFGRYSHHAAHLH